MITGAKSGIRAKLHTHIRLKCNFVNNNFGKYRSINLLQLQLEGLQQTVLSKLLFKSNLLLYKLLIDTL